MALYDVIYFVVTVLGRKADMNKKFNVINTVCLLYVVFNLCLYI